MEHERADVSEDVDIQVQKILLATSKHDTETLRQLLRTSSANVQDPETGYTPLHAAIAACESIGDEPVPRTNGHTDDDGHKDPPEEVEDHSAACKTIKLLFQNGAIWNDLDKNNETPGCMAKRLGLNEIYDLIVDAGVRAELLLNRLDDYQPLEDAMDDGEEEDEQDVVKTEGPATVDAQHDDRTVSATKLAANEEMEEVQPQVSVESKSAEQEPEQAPYLSSTLRFSSRHILDSSDNGVMMAWESKIMERTAELLAPTGGLRILNVGHGMGIIDTQFQSTAPSAHHIIEAHEAVLQQMSTEGWYDKENVTVHSGRWQDVVPQLVRDNQTFDAIYFDTFGEDYKALREFFTEFVVELLDPFGGTDGKGGKFGFFNGLGADRQVCYDVYTKVSLDP